MSFESSKLDWTGLDWTGLSSTVGITCILSGVTRIISSNVLTFLSVSKSFNRPNLSRHRNGTRRRYPKRRTLESPHKSLKHTAYSLNSTLTAETTKPQRSCSPTSSLSTPYHPFPKITTQTISSWKTIEEITSQRMTRIRPETRTYTTSHPHPLAQTCSRYYGENYPAKSCWRTGRRHLPHSPPSNYPLNNWYLPIKFPLSKHSSNVPGSCTGPYSYSGIIPQRDWRAWLNSSFLKNTFRRLLPMHHIC